MDPSSRCVGWDRGPERVQLGGARRDDAGVVCAVEGGGDGGPLAHVEGEAVDLAEVAVEAGEGGSWMVARRAERGASVCGRPCGGGQYTDWEVANPRDPICCRCGGVTTREA